MIRKVLIASTALAAIAAFTSAAQPVVAGGSCTIVSAKGRGTDETKTSARSVKHLTNKINHYAHKNKLTAVHVGMRSTGCSKKGGLDVCKSSAKVCG